MVDAERIQLEAGRKLLGVGGKTTGEAVRGELGWWSMRGRRDLCRLRFFGKIARMGREKLLKQVFDLCKPITGNMPTGEHAEAIVRPLPGACVELRKCRSY